MKRGEVWWADLGPFGHKSRRGVWQSDSLIRVLHSVLIIPLTTNLDRANLAGTAVISATPRGLAGDSVALAFQMRAVPKIALQTRIRALTDSELAELELATDEALGRVEPTGKAGRTD